MPRITKHYSITATVPFVDVHLDRDNRLFLEPSAIRAAAAGGDPYAVAADRRLTSFFSEVLRTVNAGNRAAGIDLLGRLHEPNETRLGMTRVGVAGHGVGAKLAVDLWDELSANPACQHLVLVRRIEELAPYVDRVGPDLISDMCTRIAFDVLADFTAAMVTAYPQLGSPVSVAPEYVWNLATGAWTSNDVALPTPDDRRLLLVPTNWVWPTQLLSASSFYQVQALGRIQEQQTRPSQRPGGRPSAPTKKSLRSHHPAVRPTNITQAVAAADDDGVNLTARHTAHVQHRYRDIQLNADDINALI